MLVFYYMFINKEFHYNEEIFKLPYFEEIMNDLIIHIFNHLNY